MLSIGCKPDGEPKDTRENIVARKHFVVHIPSSQHAENVTATSATLAAGHSELELVDMALTEMPGSELPRLQSCALALSCELYRAELITPKQMMVLGRVNGLYVDDACSKVDEKGRVNISAAGVDPLARLGSNDYAKLGEQITIARPK
jgi:flavin reductase (DIM6/NTAB) family NADH-FMN oxidoreductase RutF